MQDVSHATTTTDADAAAPARGRRRTNPLLLLLGAVIVAAAIGWIMYFVQVRRPVQANRDMNSGLVQTVVGLRDARPLKLDPKFVDADGDLVADAPADAKLQVDPPTLVFSFVGTDNPEAYQERFKEFVQHLGARTGKPTEYMLFRSAEEELKALSDGRLHVAGLNTGNVPVAVNQCGFVPICNLASEQGVSTYQMQLIVPADSPIQSVSDLKGKEIALTEAGSNSGFKAPLVLLRDHGLLPGKDFSIRYSGGHDASIAAIASKQYQAAAVASDLLRRAEAENPPRIQKGQYRVLYTSENFPTAGFGYVCNLKPELAQKVKDAFFSFEWKGTGVEREFAASNQTKFAPVSFKNDFALVRRIDDAIRSVSGMEAGGREIDPLTPATNEAAAAAPSTAPAESEASQQPR
ncbi:MAG TPA: phosphate/phosphite/phosphonate ABC transporter substrate-binding protein [Tepidisphaeraceae bacterium]|nr:phosphate/phosphite/phosphonate ABC transporter substrate-binding protein [Tepidisphaeraceae bacterium]